MEEIVRLKKIGFSYGEEWLFRHVDLVIKAEDFVAIIGPNGAGKSTLLRLISNVYPATEGNVELFGEDIAKFKQWGRIGYVPQNPARDQRSFPVSVEEVVSMGLLAKNSLFSRLTMADKNMIGETLAKFKVEHLRHRPIRELSGGEQQKVFLARAMVNNPELLLLDEPATGIDSKSRVELYDFLFKINEIERTTIIIVSHDLDLVSQVTKNALCINRGVCYFGEAKSVLNHHLTNHGKGY